MKTANVLLLPGWRGSGPRHWLTRWEHRHGYRRVEQHDWTRPLRGDWLARLEETVLAADEPPVLVAHGLGCILAAAWSATSAHAQRVKGALLVAPLDVAAPEPRQQLPTWSTLPLECLAFTGVLVASRNDPFCAFERARMLAAAWGAQLIDYGAGGRLDAESGLGSWPEGHVLLQDLMKD